MPKPRKLTLNEPHVVAGYKNGLTVRELAKQFNASPSTVRTTIIRNGEVLRHRGRKTRGN